jgi:protein-L-isoaspartate O-methyltransferase
MIVLCMPANICGTFLTLAHKNYFERGLFTSLLFLSLVVVPRAPLLSLLAPSYFAFPLFLVFCCNLSEQEYIFAVAVMSSDEEVQEDMMVDGDDGPLQPFPEEGGDGWGGEQAQDDEDEHAAVPMTIQALFEMLHAHNPVEARHLLQQLVLQRRPTYATHEEMVPDDRISDAYRDMPVELDELSTNLSAPHIYPAFLHELIRFAQSTGGSYHVLDVGSGTGYMSGLVSALLGPRGRVTGWEVSKEAVAFARKTWDAHSDELRSPNMAPVDFVHRDCFAMLADEELEHYDALIVGATLPRHALPHLLRLLKRPHGVLVAPIDDALTVISWSDETKVIICLMDDVYMYSISILLTCINPF